MWIDRNWNHGWVWNRFVIQSAFLACLFTSQFILDALPVIPWPRLSDYETICPFSSALRIPMDDSESCLHHCLPITSINNARQLIIFQSTSSSFSLFLQHTQSIHFTSWLNCSWLFHFFRRSSLPTSFKGKLLFDQLMIMLSTYTLQNIFFCLLQTWLSTWHQRWIFWPKWLVRSRRRRVDRIYSWSGTTIWIEILWWANKADAGTTTTWWVSFASIDRYSIKLFILTNDEFTLQSSHWPFGCQKLYRLFKGGRETRIQGFCGKITRKKNWWRSSDRWATCQGVFWT